jgi:hypothetical protein
VTSDQLEDEGSRIAPKKFSDEPSMNVVT